jgi:hypothetical protein
MSVQHSTDRILTTHVGSLPRPHALLDLMRERASGPAWETAVRDAVHACVKQQIDCGIDIPCDGEQCRVAPGDRSPGALTGAGQGDLHHPALPWRWLVATPPRSEPRLEDAEEENAPTAR